MAIALTKNDKGISTISTSVFNTDRAEHDKIDVDYARSIIGFDVVTEPICRPNGQVVPDIYNLVRTDTNEVIPTGKSVGKEFTPVQHTKMFDFLVSEILPRVPGMTLETVTTMYGGGTSLITANFGDEFRLPSDKSGHRASLIFSNPMGFSSVVISNVVTRIVCMNTYRRALKEARKSDCYYKIQHSKNANYLVDEALCAIKKEIDDTLELREQMTFLANKEANEKMVNDFLNKIYPKDNVKPETAAMTRLMGNRDEVIRQFESGETAQSMDKKTMWSLLNSATFRTFNPSKYNARTDAGEVAYDGMMGGRADKTSFMFDAAMEVAKAA